MQSKVIWKFVDVGKISECGFDVFENRKMLITFDSMIALLVMLIEPICTAKNFLHQDHDRVTFKCDCRRWRVCVGVASRSSPAGSREEFKHETEEQGENAEADTQTHDRRNAVLAEGSSAFWNKRNQAWIHFAPILAEGKFGDTSKLARFQKYFT